ncbi:bifunctional nuclease 2 isoform X2 [Pyrus x bretschneideri]|uniref:bifunctional nuclease 2 isoform X2 n=1 Tax=Pyrus x bretschneideri TaxID=225117 RepID=UPI000511AC30|nr:bifunctional nuclease 2 isoform X2 [Pyrus x bretschneideri]
MLGAGAQCRGPDRLAAIRPIPNTSSSSSSSSRHLVCTVRLGFNRSPKRCNSLKSLRIACCNSSSPSRSSKADDHHDFDYIQASLLLSETISHYRMQRRGFQEETKWQSSGKMRPFPVRASRQHNFFDTLGRNFVHRFQSPTIFLKISCDGDFLLPIVVGEFAIENLIDGQWGDENGDPPDQFHFMRNLVDKLGYQVNMVRITERVRNNYFARLYFSKPGENGFLSVDARPSDAINFAHRCKAPIYVNKQIVLTDAVRFSYGMGGGRVTKSCYDVSLDSAIEGPDSLIQELGLVKNINLAIKEERYKDAAIWRDELFKLRKSIQGP